MAQHQVAGDPTIIDQAERDPVNISVYGNPVLDVIVNVGQGALHIAEATAIQRVADIQKSGTLRFRPDSYIGFYLAEDPILWGPFNPADQQPEYAVGGKFRMPTRSGDDAKSIIAKDPDRVVFLPGPQIHIGGGGANVLFGFYDVFARLKVQLIATIEKPSRKESGRLDPFLRPLTDRIGGLTGIPIYDHPGVNLAIEGLGPSRDRTIFIAALPSDATPVGKQPSPDGKAVMVNTVYSPDVAIDALAFASSRKCLGILALTESLCSERHLEPSIFERVLARHKDFPRKDRSGFKSVKEFITSYVLPHGECILVMNEIELQSLTRVPIGANGATGATTPTFGGVIKALKAVRHFQKGNRSRVYVTLGAAGSMVLTEDNDLVFGGIVQAQGRIPVGKTAIGDTYATFILALETIGNYTGPYKIPAHEVLKAAASGADSGVYDGFGELAVNKVNVFLGDRSRKLISLGQLEAFNDDAWRDVVILNASGGHFSELEQHDFNDTESRCGTLQEVIGRAFLKV